jgi:hypothetical protein
MHAALTVECAAGPCPSTNEGKEVAVSATQTAGIPVHPVIAQMPPDFQEIYTKAYAAAAAEALQRQGTTAFEYPQRSAAIHEAGHIVIGSLDGAILDWSKIWISPSAGDDAEVWVGWTESHYPDEAMHSFGGELPLQQNLRHIRGVMAGYVAEETFEGDAARQGSSLDERVAALCMAALVADSEAEAAALLHETEQAVAVALRRRASQVKALADALVTATPEQIDGVRIASLMASVPPEMGRAEARRLRQMAKREKKAAQRMSTMATTG